MPLDFTTSALMYDLAAGREHLVQNGWCQNASREGGRVCILGGIFAVTGGQTSASISGADDRRRAACDALQSALDRKLGRYQSLASWNDEPGRTLEDALSVYDLALEDAT